MKYIATYPSQPVDVAQAKKSHENEYYRTPHGWCNGNSLGNFVKTPDGVRMVDADNYTSIAIQDEWLKQVTEDLWDHLEESIQPITGGIGEGINGFSLTNSGGTPDTLKVPPHNFFFVLSFGAGYSAFISKDGTRVLAETYTACSGNSAVIIHKEDTSVLYVNSYRHGIPGLAMTFKGMEPLEVAMYDSWRKDAKWWESGLESHETTFPPDQDDWEEIEKRLMA